MSSFKIFDIAGSGMAAQSVRLNTVASNLANAESVSGDPQLALHGAASGVRGRARQRRHAAAGQGPRRGSARERHRRRASARRRCATSRAIPLANAEGYVYAPNVNVVEEMVDMISASRAYQNNVEVMNTSKELLLATLRLGS